MRGGVREQPCLEGLRRDGQRAIPALDQVDGARQALPAYRRVASCADLNWYSVNAGTMLMPRPALTMPLTVASWSTSRMDAKLRGLVAASMYWRTLDVRDRWMKGQAAMSFGRTCASSNSGLLHRAHQVKAVAAETLGPQLRRVGARGGQREVRALAADRRYAGLRQHVGDLGFHPRILGPEAGQHRGQTSPPPREGSSATETRPLRNAALSLTLASAASTLSSICRADASNSAPSAVNSTTRVLR